MIMAFMVLSLYFVPFIYCETVVLKSGKIIEGEILEKTGEYIKINYVGVPLTYYLDDIESIKNDASGIVPGGLDYQKDTKTVQRNLPLSSYAVGQDNFMSEMEREYIRIIDSDYELSPEEKQKAIEYLKKALYSQESAGRGVAY